MLRTDALVLDRPIRRKPAGGRYLEGGRGDRPRRYCRYEVLRNRSSRRRGRRWRHSQFPERYGGTSAVAEHAQAAITERSRESDIRSQASTRILTIGERHERERQSERACHSRGSVQERL